MTSELAATSVLKKLPTKAQQEKNKNDLLGDIPLSVLLVPDLAAFSQVFPYLFLTGVGGLVEGIFPY